MWLRLTCLPVLLPVWLSCASAPSPGATTDPSRTTATAATAAGPSPAPVPAGDRPPPSVFRRVPEPPSDKPWVRGSDQPERYYQVIGSHLAQVRSCYEKGLSADANLRGRVSVQFVVGVNGRVAKIGLQESTLGNPPVETCLMQAIQAWQFPVPEGGGIVVVGYPFHFQPR